MCSFCQDTTEDLVVALKRFDFLLNEPSLNRGELKRELKGVCKLVDDLHDNFFSEDINCLGMVF